MKNISSLKIITILTGVMFLILGTKAYADYYAYRYSLDVIDFKSQGTNSQYISSNAALLWNNAANTRIGEAPQSKNLIAYYDYQDSWYGLYRPSPYVPRGVTQFSISINKRTITALRNRTYPNHTVNHIAINVAVHELGHALFLNDLDSSYKDTSIMSYGRNRTNNTPRTNDVKEIKSMKGY
ncbi:hypothetical protein ACWE42_15060 [Sutcliffiella cohnii]